MTNAASNLLYHAHESFHYRQSSCWRNLERFVESGAYDQNRARTAWLNFVDRVARKISKPESNWRESWPIADRVTVADELLDDFERAVIGD